MSDPIADPMTAPFVRTLHQGDTGSDVRAVKRALRKAGFGRGITITSKLGKTATADLERFQAHAHLKADGVYGAVTHAKLAPFFDSFGVSLLNKERAALAISQSPRNRFLAIADATVAHVSLFDYTMNGGDSPGERGYFRVAVLDWKRRYSCDCSQHFIGCGNHAGLKHPLFQTDGATGAILELDPTTLAKAQPGDAVVYVGPRYPAGDHVTILRAKLPNGDWRVINMGTQGQPAYRLLSQETASHAAIGAGELVVLELPVA